jgi:hypothetical protein
MAIVNIELIQMLKALENNFSGVQKHILKQYIKFCSDVLENLIPPNRNRYRIPNGLGVALLKNDTKETYLFTDSLGNLDSEIGIFNFSHPLYNISININTAGTFFFNEDKYILKHKTNLVRSKTKVLKVDRTISSPLKPVKKGVVYKESKEEKKQRLRDYFRPVSLPIGLGKKR